MEPWPKSTRFFFAPIVLLLLGASPGPDRPGEAALKAERLLEEAGRLEDAEKEYREALKSAVPIVHSRAAESYRRVVRARAEWQERLASSTIDSFDWLLDWVAIPLLLVFLYGLIRLSRQMGWLGRNRLEIRNWSSSSDAWKSDHFREMVVAMLHRMKPKQDMIVEMETSSRPPILIKDPGTGPVTQLMSGSAGKWFDWLLRTLRKPEYAVGGSLQVLDGVSHVIVCLDRFEKPLEVWEDTCPESTARERVKDFVYLALIAVKQGRGRPHAH